MKKLLIAVAALVLVGCHAHQPRGDSLAVTQQKLQQQEQTIMNLEKQVDSVRMEADQAKKDAEAARMKAKEAMNRKETVVVETPDMMTYSLKKGDTLYNLGKKYDVSWRELMKINNISNPRTLSIGREIKIPTK